MPMRPQHLTISPTDDFVTARSVSKGRSRLEERTLTASSLLQGYSEFPHLAQVFRLKTQVTSLTTGKVAVYERYGITSLPAQGASAQRLLALVRQHWGIESGLHYRRDVTLGEDRIPARTGHAGHVNAILNNVILATYGIQVGENANLQGLSGAKRLCRDPIRASGGSGTQGNPSMRLPCRHPSCAPTA